MGFVYLLSQLFFTLGNHSPRVFYYLILNNKSVEYIINVNLLVSPFMVSGRGIYCPPHFYFCIVAVQRKVDRTGTIMSRHHFVVLEVDLKAKTMLVDWDPDF